MKKIKIDRYFVREKGRTYEVLKFPFIKYMWVMDDWDSEGTHFSIDGSKEVYIQMKYAFAILANFPDKIIYFPCRQWRIGNCYSENYHLVLCRPELQFKRSLWVRIRRKLDRKHLSGKFVLQYDRRKLDDYIRKGLWRHYTRLISPDSGYLNIPTEMYHEMWSEHFEEMRGDTVFKVLGRTECYVCHYETAYSLERYCSGTDKYMSTWIGWLVSDGNIYDTYRRAEMEKDSIKVQNAAEGVIATEMEI